MRMRSLIWSKTEEEVRKLVDEAESFCDLAEKIGYDRYCGREVIINYCKNFNIDLTELITRGKLSPKHKGAVRKYTTEEILCENSPVRRGYIRHVVLRDKLIEYKCVYCGNTGEWMGKPLTLTLDHKNGDPTDNRLENLRFVCPNCDSQQDTYCGKNIKHTIKVRKEHKCVVCGKPIGRNSRRCRECANKSRQNSISKQDLIKLLIEFNGSMAAIGKAKHVSDNAVRKWLKKEGLPFMHKDIMDFLKELQ